VESEKLGDVFEGSYFWQVGEFMCVCVCEATELERVHELRCIVLVTVMYSIEYGTINVLVYVLNSWLVYL
jgi:hypothetical protein